MASLDLLERKLLRIISDTDPVRLKRQWVKGQKVPESEVEQRMRIDLLLRRLDKLPEAKRQEVLALLKWFSW
ncbi:hypothetical protein HP567_018795 [Brevibacillus sp. M2.1A]|uniref:hypothetical protein n=1 Tax=Brevibacillus TaxID=55080 RepID=UPI0006FB0DDF|nr:MULTISPECIES: hypothetical protein [Brevibacillus]MBY0087550.1 hypothetical protein [Brevibacillus brevis]MCC8436599.1 hypothetical protein [Brevibacillus sp. M2.1A]MCE0448590.1 hypothetical protein [Brevibacillus sp. AF8]MCM3141077.1 hypothetical protein [Brevibacillus sp. MER 51]RAT94174.1 hypothetical protein ASG16_028790 [Brevibacillus sp. Leaf182]